MEIVIHGHDDGSRRLANPTQQGIVLAEVATQAVTADFGVPACQSTNNSPRVVLAAIVDEQ